MNRRLGAFVSCAACFLPALGCKEQQPRIAVDTVKPPHETCRNVVRVSPKIQEDRLTRKVEPVYPQEAKDKNTRGAVYLHIIVGCDGKVALAEVSSGDPLLGKSALQAVQHWEYKVTLLKGEPVEVDTMVTVQFP